MGVVGRRSGWSAGTVLFFHVLRGGGGSGDHDRGAGPEPPGPGLRFGPSAPRGWPQGLRERDQLLKPPSMNGFTVNLNNGDLFTKGLHSYTSTTGSFPL